MEYRITITATPFDSVELADARMSIIHREDPEAGPVATVDTVARTIAVTVSIDADHALDAFEGARKLVMPQLGGLRVVALEVIDAATDDRPDPRDQQIREAIALLEQTRTSFKSKQVAQARELLEELLPPTVRLL